MEFRLLGPLQVAHAGGLVPLGGPQRRLVLALLLSRPNEAVSTDYLIDGVWGDDPPEVARKSLQAHVASLRRVVNLDGELLRPHPPGYVLEVDADQVDWLAFERAVSVARDRLDSDPDDARERLVEALGLWWGEALADLREEAALRPFVARLDQLRLEALEIKMEADLASGDHHAVVGELDSLVRDHPLRERLWALLMLALYRSGRQADALRAYQEARRLLGEELGIELSPLLQELEQRILNQDPILETRQALETVAPVEAGVQLRNPYKGLRAFGEEDAADFFGRKDLVRRLLERLDSRGVEGRLVALAGPSGSGKSSVVRAGLIPALRAGAMPGSQNWSICEMYPGSDPLFELAKALAGLGNMSPSHLVTILQDSAVSLKDIVAEVVERPNTLMVVDQFEEVFTLVNDPTTRDRFLRLVIDAVSDGDGRIRVVLTMRSDFLDRPLLHSNLAPLLDQGLVLVTPLSDQEIRAAVIEPAARVGVSVEPDLVAEMIQDVETRPAALPLLQFALTDLFDHRRGDTMTRESYRSAGGITGALAGRADDVDRRLDPAGQETARQLFLRLVTITDEAEHLRRRVNRSELENLPVKPGALETVMERFGQYRLLSFDRDPETGEATVEVAHEALLREWPRLSEWIDLEHEGLLLQRRLSAALKEWRQASEDTSYLVGGGRLEQFENWATQTNLALTEDESDFLAISRRFEDQRRRQQNARRWSLSAVLALAVVLVSGFALFIRDRERAATARELAAASAIVIDTDQQLSLLLALEAVRADEQAREAVEALHRAVTQSRELWQATIEAELTLAQSSAATISPDDRLVAMTFDGATVALRDRESGEIVRTLRPEAPPDTEFSPGGPGLAFSPDGNLVAAFGLDGLVRIWEVHSGMPVTQLTAASGDLQFGRGVVFGPNGRWLYTSAATQSESEFVPVIQWNTEIWAEEHRWEVDEDVAGGPAVSSDGSLLAVPLFENREVLVLDTETGSEVTKIEIAGDNLVTDAAFSSRGFMAVSAGGHITFWDPRTGEKLPVEFTAGVLSEAIVLEFDPEGFRLATGLLGEGAISVWEFARPFEEVPRAVHLLGHTGSVGDIDFDSSGDSLVSASGDGTVRMWDSSLAGQGEVASFTSRFPDDVEFFDEGRQLAVATHGNRYGMHLIDLASGEQTRIPNAYGNRVALSDDETRFAAQIAAVDEEGDQRGEGEAGYEAAVGIWETDSGKLVQRIPASLQTCPFAFGPGEYPALSHDGRFLAVGYPCERLFRVWDLESESLLTESGQIPRIRDVVFTPDDRYVVTVGTDDVVRLWESDTWSLSREVRTGGGPLEDIAFSSDGGLAAASGESGVVYVWDTQDWSLLRTLPGHSGATGRVAFGPGGKRLATAGADQTVRIWDVETGEEVLKLEGHGHPVEAVAFHPDGEHIASLSRTNWAVWVWTLDPDELIEIAEDRVTRALTDRECQTYLHVENCPTY